MTRIERIFTDWISANPLDPRHPRSILNFIWRDLNGYHAGMTQRDLAAALGYSESLICSLETAHRQPDLKAVTERFVPALGLQDDPQTAAALIERANTCLGRRCVGDSTGGARPSDFFAEMFAAARQMSLEGAFTTILAPGHVGGVHATTTSAGA